MRAAHAGTATGPLTELERAIRLLGPLEGKIMRAVWCHEVPDTFSVRDLHGVVPELAYTTVMTAAHRLADKTLLCVRRRPQRRAFAYRAAGSPSEYLERAGRDQVALTVERFGDVAFAAFATWREDAGEGDGPGAGAPGG